MLIPPPRDFKLCQLEDLPKFTVWIDRLLGLVPWEMKQKTPSEIDREYEREKWGRFLERSNELDSLSLHVVNSWLVGESKQTVCNIGDEIGLLPPLKALDYYTDLVAEVLKPFDNTSALVELGAGYGSVILGIAKKKLLNQKNLLAGELTNSGVALIEKIARSEGVTIKAGLCDFYNLQITNLPIPTGSTLFTSFAAGCIPELPNHFIDAMLSLNPSVVVHIEPCYEHCLQENLLQKLRRRYIEVNNYNRNLKKLLDKSQAEGKIDLLREVPNIYGSNPLVPLSLFIWRPVLTSNQHDVHRLFQMP